MPTTTSCFSRASLLWTTLMLLSTHLTPRPVSHMASPTVVLSSACTCPHCKPSTNILPFPTNSQPDAFISSALLIDCEYLSRLKWTLSLDAPRQRCQMTLSLSSFALRCKALPLPGVIHQRSQPVKCDRSWAQPEMVQAWQAHHCQANVHCCSPS